MSSALLIMTWVTSAVVAALIAMFAGSAAATSITYSESQTVSSPVMIGAHGQGYMMLAGTTVRDHRNKPQGSNNSSDYGYSTRGGGKGKLQEPPPLATAKPKVQGYLKIDPPGGVTVIPGDPKRNPGRFIPPTYGN